MIVDHINPKHYMLIPDKDVEVMDVIKIVLDRLDHRLNPLALYHVAAILKYALRLGAKDDPVKEIEKIGRYCKFLVEEQKRYQPGDGRMARTLEEMVTFISHRKRCSQT